MSVLMTILFTLKLGTLALSPDCSAPDAWPAQMALVHLKNAGVLSLSELDATKTKVSLLASEEVGANLFRQVHAVSFTTLTGSVIEVITRNDATRDECSGSGVDVYIVSRHLGGK